MAASITSDGDSAWPMPSMPASVDTRTMVNRYLPGSSSAIVSTPVILTSERGLAAASRLAPPKTFRKLRRCIFNSRSGRGSRRDARSSRWRARGYSTQGLRRKGTDKGHTAGANLIAAESATSLPAPRSVGIRMAPLRIPTPWQHQGAPLSPRLLAGKQMAPA